MSGHGHYRAAHPLPLMLSHWSNLICMIVLAFTGFYIHSPFFAGFMGTARSLHFFFMYLLLVTITARIIMAFTVKDASQMGSKERDWDWKNWIPQEENKHQLWETAKYYLFMRKEHVISAKNGALQKISYIATIPLTYAIAYAGFSIYTPAHHWAIWPFFQGGIDFVGGDMNMRLIHYFLMWAIILFTMIHAYLANIYGVEPTKLMFFWIETEDPHDQYHQ
jgi:Ni/Fe-hydrogenase 1 B-type cytochrome subunit